MDFLIAAAIYKSMADSTLDVNKRPTLLTLWWVHCTSAIFMALQLFDPLKIGLLYSLPAMTNLFIILEYKITEHSNMTFYA